MDACLSFKLMFGYNTNDTTNWVLSDPVNKNAHMVRMAGVNQVIFNCQPDDDSVWTFIDISE